MHEERVAAPRYRIVIRGGLGEHFAAAFADLELETRPGQSVLTGALDHAQLHGVLDRLRDLGIQLVSVNPAD